MTQDQSLSETNSLSNSIVFAAVGVGNVLRVSLVFYKKSI